LSDTPNPKRDQLFQIPFRSTQHAIRNKPVPAKLQAKTDWLCFSLGQIAKNHHFYLNLFISKSLYYITHFNIGFVFSKKVDL